MYVYNGLCRGRQSKDFDCHIGDIFDKHFRVPDIEIVQRKLHRLKPLVAVLQQQEHEHAANRRD